MAKILDGKQISERIKLELKEKVEILKKEGKKVLLVAGDTFRAGAVEQIIEWSQRVGCDVVYSESKDAASVVFDGSAPLPTRPLN